MIDGVLKRD